jgi:hypothetical protein
MGGGKGWMIAICVNIALAGYPIFSINEKKRKK